MKIPHKPPVFEELIHKIINTSPERFTEILAMGIRADPKDQYYHWDKLRYLKTPSHDLTHAEWWLGIKLARKALYRPLLHVDKYGKSFVYAEPDVVRRYLHEIDIHGGGEIKSSAPVANPHTRDTYLINSLIEEAITSSQLEGASTTRKIAKDMLREKRKPRDQSEKMISNNYQAMEFIRDIANEELTTDLILALHKILTAGTLDNPEVEGKLRERDDIIVGDPFDSSLILHEPPLAKELAERMETICRFANDNSTTSFLHPVLRAILLHFMLAYDHPFEDGNGRTARALFYWSMLKQDYWTMEFISISRILKKAPAKYKRAYLYTETDDNDVTYFIVHQLEVIVRAIDELYTYLEKKSSELKTVESLIKGATQLQKVLNHRQIALINRALKKPGSIFTIESHKGSHNVTYDTARTDLLKLEDLGLLEKRKSGKAFVFMVPGDLRERLDSK